MPPLIHSTDASEFVQLFVGNVRRRWVARHLIEWSAAGLACGCGVAAMLMLIRFGREESVAKIAWVLPLLGLICGAIGGRRTAPSVADSLRRVDRLLGDDELVSTAFDSARSSDPWGRTIAACAASRCSLARLSDAVPRRIGKRGVSLIALALTAVAVIAPFSGNGSAHRVTAQSVKSSSEKRDEDWSAWAQSSVDKTPSMTIAANTIEAKSEPSPESRSFTDQTSPPVAPHPSDGEQNTNVSQHDGTGSGMARGDGLASSFDWKARGRPISESQPVAGNTASANGSGPISQSLQQTESVFLQGTVESSDGTDIAWGKVSLPIRTDHSPSTPTIDARIDVPVKYRGLAREYFGEK